MPLSEVITNLLNVSEGCPVLYNNTCGSTSDWRQIHCPHGKHASVATSLDLVHSLDYPNTPEVIYSEVAYSH